MMPATGSFDGIWNSASIWITRLQSKPCVARHAPDAVGAAPAAEIIAFHPDQTFPPTTSFVCVWDSSSNATGGTHQSSVEGELLPVAADNFPWNRRETK